MTGSGSRADAAGARRALEELAVELDQDVEGTAEALGHYATAIGSTCQYADRLSLRRDDQGTTFDVVVVDEAARANPLDLLIALVRGERVVLVGDHIQLPHVLEPEVESALEEAGRSEARDLLGESLFSRLWDRLEAWHRAGDIRRTVRLTTQFRMHPELGDFISRQFYDDGLVTGIEAGDREHRFSTFSGRRAAWIDVPIRHGRERRDDRSLVRSAEVEVIHRLVGRLQAEDPEATIGVIAFYRAQALALAHRLGVPLGEGDGLRVGTVDAFQGRQFDAVVLSTVRSNRLRPTTEDGWKDRIGFLGLDNRLNVALSRVRRLQLVVGDLATLTEAPRVSACRPLGAYFEELCGGETHALRLR